MAIPLDTPALVLLETSNPYDMPPDAVQELADELTREIPGMAFGVAYEEQHGAGVSMHEVLHVWLPNSEWLKDTGYTTALTLIVTWMRRRFRLHGNERRPKSIIVHDTADGHEIAKLVICEEDGDTVREAVGRSRRHRPTGRHRRE